MSEAERNYLSVAEEPEFITEMPAIRPDDPVHFAQMNAMLESLLGNDVFLKRLANKMIENSLIAQVLDCENSQMVLGADQGPVITGLIDEVTEDVTQLYSDIALKAADLEKIMDYLWPDTLPLFQNGKIYAGYTFSSYKFSGTTIYAGVGGNVIAVGVQGGDGSYSTKVDLTKFTTIKVIGKSQAISSAYAAGFRVSRNADLSNYIKAVAFTASNNEYGISISDLSGEYYVGLYTHSSTDYNSCIVSRILLE